MAKKVIKLGKFFKVNHFGNLFIFTYNFFLGYPYTPWQWVQWMDGLCSEENQHGSVGAAQDRSAGQPHSGTHDIRTEILSSGKEDKQKCICRRIWKYLEGNERCWKVWGIVQTF